MFTSTYGHFSRTYVLVSVLFVSKYLILQMNFLFINCRNLFLRLLLTFIRSIDMAGQDDRDESGGKFPNSADFLLSRNLGSDQ